MTKYYNLLTKFFFIISIGRKLCKIYLYKKNHSKIFKSMNYSENRL